MKKVKNYWLAMLAFVFVLAGCEKKAEVDARDAFVGTYSYVADGEMTLKGKLPGQEDTMPLQTDGTLKITKIGEKDSVMVSGAMEGFLDSIKAVVKGSQLEILETRYEYNRDAYNLSLTISNPTAVLVKDTLTWETDVLCYGTLSVIEMEGDGHLKLTATKKSVAADN